MGHYCGAKSSPEQAGSYSQCNYVLPARFFLRVSLLRVRQGMTIGAVGLEYLLCFQAISEPRRIRPDL